MMTEFVDRPSKTLTWLGDDAPWDNPYRWDGNCTPIPGDTVNISSGHVRLSTHGRRFPEGVLLNMTGDRLDREDGG